MKTRVTIFLSLIFLLGIILTSNSIEAKNLPTKPNKTKYSQENRIQYMPGQIRVKLKQQAGKLDRLKIGATITGITSVDEKIARYEIQSIEKSFNHRPIPQNSGLPDISRIYTFYFAEDKDVQKVAKAFTRDPNIEYAEPIPIYYIEVEPNDPLFTQQGHLTQIHMPEAWGIAKGDSNIIIAIVDGGTDWEHRDLIDNIWTNQEEIEGIPRFDDDGNGYVDDFHGWDFAENDNNPTNQPSNLDAYYHGTVTAGLASARTNNGLLVAGVSWNCEIMPLKHGRDDVERAIYDWTSGAVYAAENGAHIINMSFGGFHDPFQSEQDVIDYVYSLGVLVVASAGNELISDPNHYPAGYPHVLSVTWVYDNDILTMSSPYGLSVDISAPGVELLSLNPGNTTIRMSGSSSAAPVVSGLAGLIKSRHPDWGPFQIMRQIVLTADNIDYLNPNYAGQIGSGRVNGFRAISEINPAEVPPRIKPLGVSISDSVSGNNDKILDRGETIEVIASYRNYSVSPGFNVVFSLASDDSDLTITNGTFDYGYFAPDTSIDMPIPFTFTVNNNAKGKTAQIFVGWQTDGGYSGADTFNVIVGKIPILVVDDDRADYPAEKMYTNILEDLELNHALWDRKAMGVLGPDQIANFPIVVWLCEWEFPSLDPDDQLALTNFLDTGGSLFVTGQDIGWDFNDPQGYGYEQRDFYANYLHAVYYADDSEVNDVIGVPGDPIGDGLEFTAWQPGLPADNQYPDEIEPGPGATTVFEYTGGKNHKFGIKYKGNHNVVYFGMGLEAIDSEENTPPAERSLIRTEVLSRVLNWLNFIDHTPITDTENLTESRTIVARVINNSVADFDLVGLELYWRKESDSTFTMTLMTDIGNNQYQAEIPGPGEITNIEYYIKMVNTYYEWSNPQEAPKKLYNYFVGPDQIAPTFSHVSFKSIINGEEPRSLLVAVKDNIELDTTAVYVHYTIESIPDSIRLISKDIPGQFYGDLPPVFAYGDTAFYYFTAYDNASSPNRGQSDIYSFVVGYEDFESGLTYWDTTPGGWGLDNTFFNSGEYSINDSPNQSPYPNNRDVSISTNFGIDLSTSEHAALKFWTKVYLELNHDFGYIEASNDGGLTWNQVGTAINGFIAKWQQQTVSLSSFCGPGNTDVRIRFRMVSDSTQVPPLPGWFIDDVQIIEGLDVTEVSEEIATILPERYKLYQNYPNPFNPTTTIRLDLPVAGNISLKIFNVKGELVRILINKEMNVGSYKIQWDGKNENGQSLSSGVYFYKLATNNFNTTRKLLLLK